MKRYELQRQYVQFQRPLLTIHTVVDVFRSVRNLTQGFVQEFVIRMGVVGVLDEISNEKLISRNTLHGHDEKTLKRW